MYIEDLARFINYQVRPNFVKGSHNPKLQYVQRVALYHITRYNQPISFTGKCTYIRCHANSWTSCNPGFTETQKNLIYSMLVQSVLLSNTQGSTQQMKVN